MTKEYQNQLTLLLDKLDLDLSPDIAMRVKPFFGGAAAYANGNICLSLTKVGLALKLSQAERQELEQYGQCRRGDGPRRSRDGQPGQARRPGAQHNQ